ncbi:LOW QUALITY PROTEIN: calcium permeable stress-gated cation channel 1 [Peromyscus eremicus]|uniref:LOW QUALITY PROTEIN: calcium permeable stress-gated cation channel 1 n=1 Tax=Peromyscus eremicus TaxID=42410 RepID=UPI0027DD0E91|nr:LOW QUALITY PROTEIN: calcium permeable stress-gated cation channel 1 [Peromyscus eremicus]
MSSSPEDVTPTLRNMTVNECFQSRSTVLQGQPFGGIPTVLVLNLILWVFVVVLYSFLRKAAWDYGRLALLIHNDSLTSLIYGEQSEKSSPSDVSLEAERRDKGFCSWFFNSLTMKDRDLISKCGDDARIYIMFQYHLIIYVLILCIPSLGIILPVNYIGTVLEWNSHFGRTTIVNVSTESKLLWLHGLFALMYFLINFALMGHHCLGFVPKKNLKDPGIRFSEAFLPLAQTYVSSLFHLCSICEDYKYIQCGMNPKQSSVTTIVKNYHWRVAHAPHPKDIIWKHLSIRRFNWWARFISINTFLFFLFFFLTTPAIIINTIDMYNVTRPIENLQSPVITQFFPSVLLWAFTVILPLVVYFSAFLEAHWTRSSQNIIIVHKCYIFLVFMVVILPSMGLTSLNVFLRWLFDIYYLEHATIRFQCVFLPDNGAFFVNYVITAALLGTGMELMRLGSLCTYCTRLFFSRSEPERVHIRKNQAMDFQFGREYAWMLNVFSVVMAYSITCPIIVPFGLLYLCMKHLTDRYNMYYSYAPTKLNEQIHMAAVYQAIFAPLLGLFWMLFFSILRVGTHTITFFSLSSLIFSVMIAFSGIFLGKLRVVRKYEPEEEAETVFDVEPSSTTSTPTSLLYVATVLQEPELNLTPASSPARHTYGTMNSQPEEGEEESGLRGFARELDSAQFQEGLELEGQSH